MNWIRRWEPRCYPCCKYWKNEGATIVLTNGFVKKTQKTPPAEIQLAKDRRKDYIRRKEETK
jgi:phage-related protein